MGGSSSNFPLKKRGGGGGQLLNQGNLYRKLTKASPKGWGDPDPSEYYSPVSDFFIANSASVLPQAIDTTQGCRKMFCYGGGGGHQ